MLQWYSRRPRSHKLVEPFALDGRERWGERQPAARNAEHVGGQQFGVDARRGDASL
jgi:hypothetical protein